MRRGRIVQEHIDCISKTSNVAKGHHRNSTGTLEDATLLGHCNHWTGYVGILKGIQM